MVLNKICYLLMEVAEMGVQSCVFQSLGYRFLIHLVKGHRAIENETSYL